MTGEPREPGYRVEDWLWEAKRVRSSVRQALGALDQGAVPSFMRNAARLRRAKAAIRQRSLQNLRA